MIKIRDKDFAHHLILKKEIKFKMSVCHEKWILCITSLQQAYFRTHYWFIFISVWLRYYNDVKMYCKWYIPSNHDAAVLNKQRNVLDFSWNINNKYIKTIEFIATSGECTKWLISFVIFLTWAIHSIHREVHSKVKLHAKYMTKNILNNNVTA